MKKFPGECVAPRSDVDLFWRYHILDTIKYAQDCQAVFGHFLHHFPYVGLRGAEELAAHERVAERMRDLYETTFGEPCVRRAVAKQAAVPAAPASAALSIVAMSTAFSMVTLEAKPHQGAVLANAEWNPRSPGFLTVRPSFASSINTPLK
jgi:hypothetical protein